MVRTRCRSIGIGVDFLIQQALGMVLAQGLLLLVAARADLDDCLVVKIAHIRLLYGALGRGLGNLDLNLITPIHNRRVLAGAPHLVLDFLKVQTSPDLIGASVDIAILGSLDKACLLYTSDA